MKEDIDNVDSIKRMADKIKFLTELDHAQFLDRIKTFDM